MNLEIEFSRSLKRKIRRIIKMSATGKGYLLDKNETIMLFHWVRYMHDPAYSFVPKKYRK